MRRVFLFFIAFFLICSVPGLAQPKRMEISFFGGFALPMGSWTAEGQPSDLMTGRWSPHFGKGYDDFNWGTDLTTLDDVIGEPVIKQNSGPLMGIKFGFHLTTQLQIGLSFAYALTKFQYTDEAWRDIEDTLTEGADLLESVGRTVQPTNDSVQSEGSMILLMFNANYSFIPYGQFLPYVSFGAGLTLHSGAPSLSYFLAQSWGIFGGSTYGLDVSYVTKTSLALSLGMGAKIFLGEAFGIKIEANGIFSPVSLDEEMTTSFSRTMTGWTEYYPYDDVISTQKSSRIIVSLQGGLFFAF